MSKKISIAAFILAGAIFFSLSGCGLVVIHYDKFGDGNGTAETDISTEPTESAAETKPGPEAVVYDHSETIAKYMASLPEMDCGGSAFQIISPDTSSLGVGDGLDFLSETAAARNEAVAEKFNVSLVITKTDYSVMYSEVSTAVKSGMYYADLMLLPQEAVGSFAASGLLMNMRSMPGLDFEAQYFNKSSVEAGAGGFTSYALAGYASIYPYSLPAVFFNTRLAEETGENPYTLVKSGEWTWDKFFEISAAASGPDGIYSWGSTMLGDGVYEAAFVSCGNRMVNSGLMQVPAVAIDAESGDAAAKILQRLGSDAGAAFSSPVAEDYFYDGRGYFLIDKLAEMQTLKVSSVQWGILPLPKAEKSGGYTTLAGADSFMFTCPATVSTSEKSAVILMAMNAASYGIVRDAYVSFAQYNFLRDNESANMLEYIIDGTVFDFAYTYGGIYDGVANGTYYMLRDAAVPGASFENLVYNRVGAANYVFSVNFGLAN